MNCPLHDWPLKDEGGCWQCYDERRMASKKQAKAATPKKLYEIPKVSAKKKEREKALSKVRTAAKKQIAMCQSCTNPEGPLDYSHILSVKQYPQHEANPINAVIECRKCHHEWENSPLEVKMKQRSWPQKLKVILQLEPAHWNKMQLKQAS